MAGNGSFGGGGGEGLTGRAATGYDHGYDGEVFYLGLALDERYVEGWVEGAAWRRSGKTTPTRNGSSEISGRMTPSGRW